jgi:serine/threonine-protein kinase
MTMPCPNLKSIFADAVARPEGPGRAAYLDRACRGDAALRAEVEAMVRDHERLGRFLASARDARADVSVSLGPVSSSTLSELAETLGGLPRILLRETEAAGTAEPLVQAASPELPSPSERNSRYQLFGEIARGGMGAVLKGRDPDLGREMAVKVLLEEHRDDVALVRRFIEEAQIGGQLQHPGIVPVYDVGSFADRRPFFTMKLVKGHTLAALLRGRSHPSEGLPRFLGIFEQVCQTVAYAHDRGVIHRDLKPSNVMVGGFGEVQVMDWGLAKVLPRGGVADDAAAGKTDRETVIATARSGGNRSDLSRAGSVLGTPSYMAPEQARGEVDRVDERADVFALGSILCEILTGEPAFTGPSSLEILHSAARGETGAARERLDGCGADAELVALARDCLAADRDDRPRDASVIAGRVTAYLAGVQERVKAAERQRAVAEATAVEERKRRKLQVGLAASLLILTTLGGLCTTYYLQQCAARAAAIDRLLGEARTMHALAAQESENVAKWDAVLAALRQAEAVAEADPEARRQLDRIRAEARARGDAARRDRTLLEDLADVRSTKEDLGPVDADAAYARAFREAGVDLESLAPGAGARLKARPTSLVVAAASALDDWALVRRTHRPKDDRWRRPLEAARAADPDPFRDRVRAAVLGPDETARQAALVKLAASSEAAELPTPSAVLLGTTLKDSAAAVALLRAASGRHPDDVWVNHTLAKRLGELRPAPREEQVRYYAMARAVRPESAHELAHLLDEMGRADEALAVFADLTARRASDPRRLMCYFLCLSNHGRHEAGEVLARAVAAGRASVRLRPQDARAQNGLGAALQELRKQDEAIAAYREAVRLDPDYARAHGNLGVALVLEQTPAKAIAAFPEAIAEVREAMRLDPDDVSSYLSVAYVLASLGRNDEATAAARETVRLRPDNPEAYAQLGCALQVQGKLDEALAPYREAIRLKPDERLAQCNLGETLAGLGKIEEGITAYHEALRLMPYWATGRRCLAGTLRQKGDFKGSLAEYRKLRDQVANRPDWAIISREMVELAERMVVLADRLPGILKGGDRPRDNAERILFAQMCSDTMYYAAAVRLYAEALESNPGLVRDRAARHCYGAGRAAALAAAGRGNDEPPPDDAQKVTLRGQSLVWLKAELAAWDDAIASGPPQTRSEAFHTLRRWRQDWRLASVRESEDLAKLPMAERKKWEALWVEIEAVIQRAATSENQRHDVLDENEDIR